MEETGSSEEVQDMEEIKNDVMEFLNITEDELDDDNKFKQAVGKKLKEILSELAL